MIYESFAHTQYVLIDTFIVGVALQMRSVDKKTTKKQYSPALNLEAHIVCFV